MNQILVLLHLPRQRNHVRNKLQDVFLFSEAHGLHLYDGRPLTIEEFNRVAEKHLSAQHYAIRPLVRILEVEAEESKENAEGSKQPEFVPPTQEELRVIFEAMDKLRAENRLLRDSINEIEKNAEAVARLKLEQDKEAEAAGIAAAAAEKDREASQQGAPDSAPGSTSAPASTPAASAAGSASESGTGVVSPPNTAVVAEKVTTGQLPDEPPETGGETEGSTTQAPAAPADGADSATPAKAAKPAKAANKAPKKATEGQGQGQ